MVDLTTSEVERAGENLRRLEERAREWLAALGIRLGDDPYHREDGATFVRWGNQLAAGEIPAEWKWKGDGPLTASRCRRSPRSPAAAAEQRARKVREIHGALTYAAWVHRLGWLWGRACEAAGIARAVADAAAAAEGRPGACEYQPEALRLLVTILAESTDLLSAIAPADVVRGQTPSEGGKAKAARRREKDDQLFSDLRREYPNATASEIVEHAADQTKLSIDTLLKRERKWRQARQSEAD